MKLERTNWQEKEIAAQKAAAEQNRKHELAFAAVGTQLATEKAAHEATRRNDRSRALSGDIRLRVPVSCPASPSSPASGSDGSKDSELPREIVADLLDLANDADEVVRQLTACQQVLRSER